MQAGTIKWFDVAKGFGFVVPEEGGNDVYVHAKVLAKAKLDTIEAGTAVNFSVSLRSGKAFVEDIAVVAAPVPVPQRLRPSKSVAPPVVDAEDDFEREWGLRRA